MPPKIKASQTIRVRMESRSGGKGTTPKRDRDAQRQPGIDGLDRNHFCDSLAIATASACAS